MNIIFKNQEGFTEICFRENKCQNGQRLFYTIIQHEPFSVEMITSFNEKELLLFSEGLTYVKSGSLGQLSLSSTNRELVIIIESDTSGHIIADVTVSAGSRGSLQFSFEFDQSFINEIIDDTQ